MFMHCTGAGYKSGASGSRGITISLSGSTLTIETGELRVGCGKFITAHPDEISLLFKLIY